MMTNKERKKLTAAGWRIGTADEFLGLTPEESALVTLRLALRDALKDHRKRAKLTQVALAKRLHSSQSRVAKIEAGNASVSLDLIFRALLATGASANDIAKAIHT